MKEGELSIHEPFHRLGKIVMSDLTTQMFPEALNRMKLRGVGKQTHKLHLVLMGKMPDLNGFSKVDAVFIHHDVDFVSRFGGICGNQLCQHLAKEALSLCSLVTQYSLPLPPMDQSDSLLLFVLAWRLNLALVALFAPTAHDSRQQREIHPIFVVEVNFASQGSFLQLVEANTFLFVGWIRATHRKDGALNTVALPMQGTTGHTFR
jgi:hypothetical protein